MEAGQLKGWRHEDFPMRAPVKHADALGVWRSLGMLWDWCPNWYYTESPYLDAASHFVQTVLAVKSGIMRARWTRAGLDAATRLLALHAALHAPEAP